MNNKIIMNKPMRKLLESKYLGVCFLLNKKSIIDEIDSFFNGVKMYSKDGKKCFSLDNIFDSDLYSQNDSLSVADWEWKTNEIYLDKTLIKNQYKKTILLSSKYIEKKLLEKFPQNSFVINFCIQFGKYRNINIRVCQDLEDAVFDKDLDKYNQPVMQIYLKT